LKGSRRKKRSSKRKEEKSKGPKPLFPRETGELKKF